MIRPLDKERLRAELGQVKRLLRQTPESAGVARLTLEVRAEDLEEELRDVEDAPAPLHASTAIFFSGKPVKGSHSIDIDFMVKALGSYQNLVSLVAAASSGRAIRHDGPIPQAAQSALHVARAGLRGSYGFVLEEPVEAQQPLISTALKDAVDDTVALITSAAETDDSAFTSIAANYPARVLEHLGGFFKHLSVSEAWVRVMTHDVDTRVEEDGIANALERASSVRVDEKKMQVGGYFRGHDSDGRSFRFFIAANGETITGKFPPDTPKDEVDGWAKLYGDKLFCHATFIKRTAKHKDKVRTTYTLLEAERFDSAPEDDGSSG